MKVPEKSKEKKEKIKKRETIKPKKEHVLIVAQEIKFARLLSGNEKKTRDKVLNTMKKWLLNCFDKGYEFKEDDFIRVWKGLFYAVWMSDKPLVQEELCEKIAGVLDLFPEDHLRDALLMFKAGLRVLATEWYGLDQHRTDKFLMLVRRYLRASLRCLLRSEWSLKSCQMYAKTLSGTDGIFALKTPHYARNSMSMLLHIVDCFLEELAKVSNGDIPDASVVELLRPLCGYLCAGEAPALCAAARRLLTALLRQSDQGLRYQHATQAWQKMGCPEGGPEALELVSDSEDGVDDDEEHPGSSDDENDESSEKPLDPRAGRVNVELPCLPVPAALLADMLRAELPSASSGRHKRVKICLERFEQLSRSEYPLRVSTHTEDNPTPPIKHKKSAQSLYALEKKLVAASDDLALRGLSRKHRKRLLAKSRSGTSIVEEVDAVRQKLSTNVTNGGWQVEMEEPKAKKPKQNTTNKDIKKRQNNTTDASGKKRKVNGDATHKQQNVAKRQKVAKENNPIVTKLDNAQSVDQSVNGQKKDKVSQNGQKINDRVNQKSNKKVSKVTENGVKNDKSKISVKVLDNKTDNSVTDKSNKKPQKNHDKILLNGKNKKLEKPSSPKSENKNTKIDTKTAKNPTLLVNKVKKFQKKTEIKKKTELQMQMSKIDKMNSENNLDTPKKVKFALKNNSMQQPVDYYKSVRQSPSIPFDGAKKPSKTNLKPSTPSPINPFHKKKLRLKR